MAYEGRGLGQTPRSAGFAFVSIRAIQRRLEIAFSKFTVKGGQQC
jgi:hypothetical protein